MIQLERFAKALMRGKPLSFTISGSEYFCDWSDGVYHINFAEIHEGMSEEYLRYLKGMLIHEVSHGLYTDFDSIQGITDSKIRSCINILEDFRIEKLICSEYLGAEAELKYSRSYLVKNKICNNSDLEILWYIMNGFKHPCDRYVDIFLKVSEYTDLAKNVASTLDLIPIAEKVASLLDIEKSDTEDYQEGTYVLTDSTFQTQELVRPVTRDRDRIITLGKKVYTPNLPKVNYYANRLRNIMSNQQDTIFTSSYGEIDYESIHHYGYADIFKLATQEEVQTHTFCIALDLSISMPISDSVYLLQVIIKLFGACNVPFKVFGYTSSPELKKMKPVPEGYTRANPIQIQVFKEYDAPARTDLLYIDHQGDTPTPDAFDYGIRWLQVDGGRTFIHITDGVPSFDINPNRALAISKNMLSCMKKKGINVINIGFKDSSVKQLDPDALITDKETFLPQFYKELVKCLKKI